MLIAQIERVQFVNDITVLLPSFLLKAKNLVQSNILRQEAVQGHLFSAGRRYCTPFFTCLTTCSIANSLVFSFCFSFFEAELLHLVTKFWKYYHMGRHINQPIKFCSAGLLCFFNPSCANQRQERSFRHATLW